MRFLLFGTGDYYERYKKWFKDREVLALLDNSPQKQNMCIDGWRVITPKEGVKLPYDAIVILSFYVKDMKEQLKTLGVPTEKIYHFYDLHNLLQLEKMDGVVRFWGGAETVIRNKKKIKKILLLSQELSLGGPSIALFHVAKVLKKHKFEVIFGSMIDGPLREELLINDIPVIIDSNLQIATMREMDWIKDFSLIVCSTINFHIFLTEQDREIPIIWWIHDAAFFYDGVRSENFAKICRRNLRVVSVGPIPRNALARFMPDVPIGELLYGVADRNDEKYIKKYSKKVRFALIGFFEDIKGQDILLRAMELVPESIRNHMEVLFVGHDETLYAQELKEKYKNYKEVQYLGSVGRDKIHEIFCHIDILICPSRQDSMPTVAAEAMMHGRPCIVSDAIGTAEYIQNGVNGFVFPSENTEQLALKMRWCVTHYDELPQMGIEARKIYEKCFSMDVFEQNLLKIVNHELNEEERLMVKQKL